MLKNYLIIALRYIYRQKAFSFINIFGLALGLACALLILLWVEDEVSYDRFHDKLERIYRVEENQHYSGQVYHVNVTPYISGPVWRDKIPEITEAVRMQFCPGILFVRGEKKFFENSVRAVDSTIFNVFNFPLVSGNPVTALTQPYSIILSEELAEKYFGEEDPLQQTIMLNQFNFTITGVMKKIPNNSSIRFDAIVPFDFIREFYYSDHWGSNSILTFVMLEPNTDPGPVDAKLTAIYKENLPDGTTDFLLAPLKRMHLYSYFGYDHDPSAIRFVYIFSVIALFVLLIACINFMNLSTARASGRGREIGIRKVVGGTRFSLFNQFLGESVLLAFLAMILALLIVGSLMEVFNLVSGKDLSLLVLLRSRFILGTLAVTIIAGSVAGLYPAVFLSSFNPVRAIKGEGPLVKRATLRKALVVVQFSLSIFMMAGTMVVYNQLDYMKRRDLGYNKENLLYIPIRGEIRNQYESLKNELVKNPSVVAVTATSHRPNNIGSNSAGVEWPGKPEDLKLLITTSGVDFDYLETMGMSLAKGRDFTREFVADRAQDTTANFLINEELERIIGADEIIGLPFKFMGLSGTVIGVIRNFHYQPVSNLIEPLATVVAPVEWLQYILIRIRPGNIPGILKSLEETWNRVLPSYPFDFQFLDEELDNAYRTETRMGTLLKYFSIVAVLIACMGLLGLSSLTASQRIREFGIRKALGAGHGRIAGLLVRDFIILILVSIVIGTPLAWYYSDRFLQDFAYRSGLHWWLFASAAFLALLVALLTISYHAWKSARTQPADALRYE